MTDQEIIQGLIERNERITREFFFRRCQPLFFALIATFVGNGLADVTKSGEGVVTALVLLISALLMLLCGLLRKKLGWKWLNDYAVPICMVLSMLAAIPLTSWIV